MIKVNIFRDVWDKDCSHKVDIVDVLNAIGVGRWEKRIKQLRECDDENEQKKLKNMLPCVTFCGTFNTSRQASNIDVYNGLFMADIDKISYRRKKSLRKELNTDPFVMSYFDSPVKGLKVLIKVNTSIDDHKLYAFSAVSNYFKKVYDISIDPSGKDLCRLCFVSYDPEIGWNEESDVLDCYNSEFSYKEWVPVRKSEKFNKDVKILTNEDLVYKRILEWLKKSDIRYTKGNRNNYLFIACCNLNRAGVSEDGMERILTKFHNISPEMYPELQGVIKSVQKHHKHEFNTRPIWDTSKRNRIQGSLLMDQ